MAYGKSSKDAEIKRASLPFPGYFGIEAKTLPLELTWDYQDVRKRATYPVTLKLLGAEVPESFPAGHFDIPDGAKLLSAGTQELVPD